MENNKNSASDRKFEGSKMGEEELVSINCKLILTGKKLIFFTSIKAAPFLEFGCRFFKLLSVI